MLNKNKPEITRKVIKGNKIIELEIKKIVKKMGGSGYISVPAELIGKRVLILYKEEKRENNYL